MSLSSSYGVLTRAFRSSNFALAIAATVPCATVRLRRTMTDCDRIAIRKASKETRNLGVPSETLTFNSDQIGRAGTTNLSELRRVVDF